MNSIRLVLICIVILNVFGCKGSGVKTNRPNTADNDSIHFSGVFRFTEKGINQKGDIVYIIVRSKEKIFADLAYESAKGKWSVIKRNAPSRRFRVKNQGDAEQASTSYFVRFVWRIPDFSTQSLKFKLSVATPDGRKTEKILNTRKIVDSVVPSSTATFNPFLLKGK